jgi:redox-sensitive bicupin YhaK (pirin superfamily)
MKMKLKLHIADTRVVAEHDWLSSRHTFSFAGYHNPERMRFGLLREINDDVVQPGMGFGTHLHDDMEIISIPFAGKLRHRDSMGHTQNITVGEVQIMSALTGITHPEYNGFESEVVNFLQIWVFPEKRGIEPHYDQKLFSVDGRQGRLQNIVSPDQNDGGVWINQQSWFWLGDFKAVNRISILSKNPETASIFSCLKAWFLLPASSWSAVTELVLKALKLSILKRQRIVIYW